MENIKILKTEKTLGVDLNFNKGVFNFDGVFMIERASTFFDPIISIIKDYLENCDSFVELNINIEFMNTPAIREMYSIFTLFEKYYKRTNNCNVNWSYERDDETMLEKAEIYQGIFKVPFKFIEF